MNRQELLEYIKNRQYLCEFCYGLKQEVLKHGLDAITNYKGMICGGVEDMIIRLYEADHPNEDEPAK